MTRNWILLAAAAAMAAAPALAQSSPQRAAAAERQAQRQAQQAQRQELQAQRQTQRRAQIQARRAVRMPGANLRLRIMRQLDLTENQKTEAQTIFEQAAQAARPILEQLRQNRQEMARAVNANDPVRIQQLATAAGSLQGQLSAIRFSAMAKFYAILTPEQKAKADRMRGLIQQMFQQEGAGRQV